MNKRREPRIRKGFLVELSRRGMEQLGVTVNVSRRGMCVATTGVLRRSCRLRVVIAAADELFSLTGRVVWNLKRAPLSPMDVPAEIGVRIEEAPQAYYRFIAAARRTAQLPPMDQSTC
ncbi:MAG: PilZ domain-containing protein [Acidobacteria bacterium]|jgi:hypothetical protein|nr:PilZ domain-containing protein [Acidobacteriota bacterium]